jgi:hypothetical protein
MTVTSSIVCGRAHPYIMSPKPCWAPYRRRGSAGAGRRIAEGHRSPRRLYGAERRSARLARRGNHRVGAVRAGAGSPVQCHLESCGTARLVVRLLLVHQKDARATAIAALMHITTSEADHRRNGSETACARRCVVAALIDQRCQGLDRFASRRPTGPIVRNPHFRQSALERSHRVVQRHLHGAFGMCRSCAICAVVQPW